MPILRNDAVSEQGWDGGAGKLALDNIKLCAEITKQNVGVVNARNAKLGNMTTLIWDIIYLKYPMK